MKFLKYFRQICVLALLATAFPGSARYYSLYITGTENIAYQFFVDDNLRLDVVGEELQIHYAMWCAPARDEQHPLNYFAFPLSSITEFAYDEPFSSVEGIASDSRPVCRLSADALSITMPHSEPVDYTILRTDGIAVTRGRFAGSIDIPLSELPKGILLLSIPQMPTIKICVK